MKRIALVKSTFFARRVFLGANTSFHMRGMWIENGRLMAIRAMISGVQTIFPETTG